MPVVARLDDLVTRVLAPNPSPMTLDGTNTYVLSSRGSGDAVVVDPGPRDTAHLERVRGVLDEIDARCELILVTHHHVDHAEAAATWAQALGCRVAAATAGVAGPGGLVLEDGDRLTTGDLDIEVVPTPGHAGDHLAFRLGHGPLLTGDHVLGRGTSVVAHPDGDLTAYLDSLRRVLDLGPDALYPGHGPELAEDPTSVITYYLDHRAYREAQVVAALASAAEPRTPRQVVEVVYADVDRGLWGAAELSTRAALAKLAHEHRVDEDGDTYRLADQP